MGQETDTLTGAFLNCSPCTFAAERSRVRRFRRSSSTPNVVSSAQPVRQARFSRLAFSSQKLVFERQSLVGTCEDKFIELRASKGLLRGSASRHSHKLLRLSTRAFLSDHLTDASRVPRSCVEVFAPTARSLASKLRQRRAGHHYSWRLFHQPPLDIRRQLDWCVRVTCGPHRTRILRSPS